jgi:hypothetical protein
MNKKSNLCRICMEGNSMNNIFFTMAAGDLIANLLIDLADIEVDGESANFLQKNVCLKVLCFPFRWIVRTLYPCPTTFATCVK